MSKIIKIPFPEFLDVIEAIAGNEETMDLEIEITGKTAVALNNESIDIANITTRLYYMELTSKWITRLNNETTDP